MDEYGLWILFAILMNAFVINRWARRIHAELVLCRASVVDVELTIDAYGVKVDEHLKEIRLSAGESALSLDKINDAVGNMSRAGRAPDIECADTYPRRMQV